MKLRKEFKIRDIAGEKVVIMQGQYGSDMTKIITLNDSSEFLWNELQDKDFDAQSITQILLDNYDVEPTVAERDAEAWVARLLECKLVEE